MNDLQLKDTAERIKAVDAATALVEEMMRQGPPSAGALQSGGVSSYIAFSTLVLAYVIVWFMVVKNGIWRKTTSIFLSFSKVFLICQCDVCRSQCFVVTYCSSAINEQWHLSWPGCFKYMTRYFYSDGF